MGQEVYIGKRVERAGKLDEIKSRLLDSDEKLLCVVHGLIERGGRTISLATAGTKPIGILLVTSKKVIFYTPKIFGRQYEERIDFLYDKISAVYSGKMAFNDMLQLTVASDMVTFITPKGDARIAAKYIQDMVATMKAQPSLTVATPQIDIADQIEKLAALRDKGIITEEEFKDKKKQLLGL